MSYRLDGKEHEWPKMQRRRWWEGCGVGDELPTHQQRLDGMEFWRLRYSPDLTEGRGFHRRCIIALDCYPYCDMHQARMRRVTILLAEEPILFIMGVGATDGWHLHKMTREEWDARDAGFAGREKATRLFLSEGPHLTGYPEAATMDDLASRETLEAKMEAIA